MSDITCCKEPRRMVVGKVLSHKKTGLGILNTVWYCTNCEALGMVEGGERQC